MTVRYRSERGAWYVDVVVNHPDGTWERIRARSPVNTKRAALEHERRLVEEALTRRANPLPQERRLDEFAEEFTKTYVLPNNKPSEAEAKRSALASRILPRFGSHLLSEVTALEVERFKAEMLAEGLSPKRTNNLLGVLHRMLVVAHEWGFLAAVPKFKLLKVPPQEFDFLTFEEADRLVAAADPSWRPMVLTAVKTGLRMGELRALRWEDVDLAAGRLVVRQAAWLDQVGTTKTGQSRREVPLCEALLVALKQHHHLRGPLVFCNRDGSMLSTNDCEYHLRERICRHAGLRRFGWHVLRHTFASHLVMRGVPLKVVQELLGHTTIQMTMRYSHLAPDVSREAVKVLDLPASAPPSWHQYGTSAEDGSASSGRT